MILGRTHLHALLLAAVIYKSSMAAGDGPVALCCREMLSLAGVSGGTDCGSGTSWSRAAPGHTQQAHTEEVYMLRPASSTVLHGESLRGGAEIQSSPVSLGSVPVVSFQTTNSSAN